MEQYELNWKDYYGILGIGPGAEPEVIKAAYTALARKYHPDAGGDAPRMKEINESYEVLSNPQKGHSMTVTTGRKVVEVARAKPAGNRRRRIR